MRRTSSVPSLQTVPDVSNEVEMQAMELDGNRDRSLSDPLANGPQEPVMMKLCKLLETNDLDSFDLNTLTSDQYKRLTILQQESNLIEQPASLVFRNLSLFREERRMFQSVSGFLKPGMLVMAMGPSDSGVSSLLKVLAGRYKGGTISGEILLNGSRPSADSTKIISYVPFEDLHIGHMKVKEAIKFSLKLRASPLIPQKFLDFQCRLILHVLKLTHRASSKIGSATMRGISGGERRRLTIGLEVAAGHAIMLMDSPTNGLDSQSAMELASIARGLCDCGRSAMMSLVQVSPDLFSKFDFVLLQSRGLLVYFGPSSTALRYMEYLGYQLPKSKTVPDFLAEILNEPSAYYVGRGPAALLSTDASLFESDYNQSSATFFSQIPLTSPLAQMQGGKASLLAKSYRNSKLYEEVGRVLWLDQVKSESAVYRTLGQSSTNTLKGAIREVLAQKATTIASRPSKFNSSLTSQFWTCLRREVIIGMREKSKTIARLGRAVIVALVAGIVFWGLGDSQSASISRLGALAVIVGFVGYDGVDEIPQIFQSRSMFYAQRNAGYFRVFAYFLANIIADLPIIAFQIFLLSLVFYPMANMNNGIFSSNFAMFTLLILQVAMTARAWTSFIANLIPIEIMAITIAIISNDFFFYFQGFVLPSNMIPWFWKWLNFSSYFTRMFKALAINELSGRVLICLPAEVCRWNSGEELLESYGFSSNLTPVQLWGVSWIFLGIFHCLSIMCMALLNFEQRNGAEKGVEHSVSRSQYTQNEQKMTINEHAAESVVNLKMSTSSVGTELSFESLSYHVGPLTLLHNITGFARPGMVIALLGPSGAGKTTLLDVLAMRKTTGEITGVLNVDGQPRGSSFRRMVAYVEQVDSLPSFVTVREAIEESALLRLPRDVSKIDRNAIVEDLLERLNLKSIQDSIASDLSGDLRKTVSIACELASIKPGCGVLFCDESTTGLDSSGAMRVVKSITKASASLPVLCTIHQPSAELMEAFNWVLLLRKGGHLAYFGPTNGLAAYAKRAGFPDYHSSENIAEYALRTVCVTEPQVDTPMILPTEISAEEPQAKTEKAESQFDRLGVKSSKEAFSILGGGSVPQMSSRASTWTVLRTIFRRRLLAEIRDRSSLLTRLIAMTVLACTVGSMFFQLPSTYGGVSSRLAFIFSMANMLSWAQASKLSSIINERPCYYRELALGMYGEATYFIASTLADSPLILLQTLITCIPAYLLAGFSSDPFSLITFILVIWLCAEASAGAVRLIAAMSPNATVANGILSAVFTTYMTFGGFLLVYSAMPSFTRVFFYLSFFRYAIFFCFAVEVNSLGPNIDCSAVPDVASAVCGQAILSQYGIIISDIWYYFLGLIAVLVGHRLLAIVILKTVKHIKR